MGFLTNIRLAEWSFPTLNISQDAWDGLQGLMAVQLSEYDTPGVLGLLHVWLACLRALRFVFLETAPAEKLGRVMRGLGRGDSTRSSSSRALL